MNNSKYRFTLDMHSTISQVSLPVRENDAGIELRITLTDGGTPYHIADGCRAVFCARKSDDKYLLNDCIIEKNTTIYYKLTQQTTAAKGVVDCEIRVYGIDNNLLTSPKFILVVSDRVWHDSDFPMSDTEKHAIDKIFANETSRQDAEASRVIAEEEREKTYQEMLDTVKEASDAADILTEKIATGDYNGQNGLTPFIGANGNWWIGDEDTGVLADGYSIPLRKGSGKNSVEQIGCEAREENSVALGEGTIASARGQFVAGRYSKENPNALLIVGNGTPAVKDDEGNVTKEAVLSNALEVLEDGTIPGSVQIAKGTATWVRENSYSYLVGSSDPSRQNHYAYSLEINLGFKPVFFEITGSISGTSTESISLANHIGLYLTRNTEPEYMHGDLTRYDGHTYTRVIRKTSAVNSLPVVSYIAIGRAEVLDPALKTTVILKDTSGKVLATRTTYLENPEIYLGRVFHSNTLDQYNWHDEYASTIKFNWFDFYQTEWSKTLDDYILSPDKNGGGTGVDDIAVQSASKGTVVTLTPGKTYTYYLIKK